MCVDVMPTKKSPSNRGSRAPNARVQISASSIVCKPANRVRAECTARSGGLLAVFGRGNRLNGGSAERRDGGNRGTAERRNGLRRRCAQIRGALRVPRRR